jgi:hypothetical protein
MRSRAVLIFPFFFLAIMAAPAHGLDLNIPELENTAKTHKDPAVFYDLGVLYSNSGNTGKAVLNFKKALLLRQSDKDASANLNNLRQSIGIPPYYSESSPIEKAVLFPFSFFSLNGGAVFGFVLFLLGSAGLSIVLSGLFQVPRTGLIRTVSIVLLAVGAVYLVSSFIRYRFTFDPANAVVLLDSKLLERPDGDALSLADIPGGMECVVRDEMNAYFRISTLDGREGWTAGTNVERLWEGEK